MKTLVCLGDSITYGQGLLDRARYNYPSRLEESDAYGTFNFGVNGATLNPLSSQGYQSTPAYIESRKTECDWILLLLGTNDSKKENRLKRKLFYNYYNALLDEIESDHSGCRIIIATPPPAFSPLYGISNNWLKNEIAPIIRKIGKRRNIPVNDLNIFFDGKRDCFYDGIHPNRKGAALIAASFDNLLETLLN